MKKSKQDKKAMWWLFGIGSVLIYLKRRIDSIHVQLQNIGIAHIDTAQRMATIQLVLGVALPLPFGVTVRRLTGTLYIMGKAVATFDQQVDRYIESDSITPISLLVDVDLTQLANGVLANIQTGNISTLLIQLDARATTNVLPIRIHKTLTGGDIV